MTVNLPTDLVTALNATATDADTDEFTEFDPDAMGTAVGAAIAHQPETSAADDIDVAGLKMALTRQHPEAFSVGLPYNPTPPMSTWSCDDTFRELLGLAPRALPTRPAPSGTELTVSDYFAGAGGSSSGIHMVPGLHVAIAVNHWPLAIETHNLNHPYTDHDTANVARVDPRRYPSTDIGWFSPECTNWSVAKGEKCDYDEASQQTVLDVMDGDPETPEAKEAKWRSRMLMRDVVRFSEVHDYKGVIVENVPDILKWAAFDRWIGEMAKLGYKHKVISLNSAFAQALGAPAPQLRDRVYIVFWKAQYKTPNWRKWLSPKAFCPGCEEIVEAIYNPKPGKRRPMRYGHRAQYTYRCPKTSCRGQQVQPLVVPASEAIDWSLQGERIGDKPIKRHKDGSTGPLARKTLARIAAGLRKYRTPITLDTAGHTFERRPGVRTAPVSRPIGTLHTTASKSLAYQPEMLVPTGGNWNDDATLLDQPMRTRTTRESEALVVPMEGRGPVSSIRQVNHPFRAQTARHQDALVVPLRNNGNAEPTSAPLRTFAAGGQHHALVNPNQGAFVMRNNTPRGDASQMSTPVDEPIRTITTAGHQSLVSWLYAYDTGRMRPLHEPMPSQTTVEGDGLLSLEDLDLAEVDDCTLRMLAVKEIQAGMAFTDDYVLLGTAKRDKVRMLGNAVTPPASRDLAACLMEAITGIDIPLYA
jgi:DNA (cytosine-5)-methyltransferase 1